MTSLIIILLLVGGILLWVQSMKRKQGTPDQKPAASAAVTQVTTEEPDIRTGVLDFTDDVNDVFIAGLAHHCTKKDIDYFSGVIFNEKDNAYDRKAMAIGNRQTRKIVGYIPAAILSEYRSWCGRKDCACVGYIFFDGSQLRGRVRAYHPSADPEKVNEDAVAYCTAVAEHFGWPAHDLN